MGGHADRSSIWLRHIHFLCRHVFLCVCSTNTRKPLTGFAPTGGGGRQIKRPRVNGEGVWASWLMTFNPHPPSLGQGWLTSSESRRQKGPGETRKAEHAGEARAGAAGSTDSVQFSVWLSSQIHTPETSRLRWTEDLLQKPRLMILQRPEPWCGRTGGLSPS